MRLLSALALLVSSCGALPTPPVPLSAVVPPKLQVCPAGQRPKPPPPPPRTVQQVVDWAKGVYLAWQVTEAARIECAKRLDGVNHIIEQDLLPQVAN